MVETPAICTRLINNLAELGQINKKLPKSMITIGSIACSLLIVCCVYIGRSIANGLIYGKQATHIYVHDSLYKQGLPHNKANFVFVYTIIDKLWISLGTNDRKWG